MREVTCFWVLCRDDWDEISKLPGRYVLATRRVFESREQAETYARTISDSREPIVVAPVVED